MALFYRHPLSHDLDAMLIFFRDSFRLRSVLPLVALLVLPGQVHGVQWFPLGAPEPSWRFDRLLGLTNAQRSKLDPIVIKYQRRIGAIGRDRSLSVTEKRRQIDEEVDAMIGELKPALTPEQVTRLSSLNLDEVLTSRPKGFHPQAALNYQVFFPTSSETRSIFGSRPASFGVGLESYDQAIGRRVRVGLGLDAFTIPGSSNMLLVGAPLGTLEYRLPLVRRAYAYGGLAAGPALMDYSFDTPSGRHFSAKRGGLDSRFELGLKWGFFRVAGTYRLLSQPAGISFDQFAATAFVTVYRF
jgi:hypothetical protein